MQQWMREEETKRRWYVQGRKSRHRSPADIEKIVCLNYAEGMRSFFITDDNFARNKDWESILDRLIHLREIEKLDIGFIIQVDTLCHKLPNFIEKCARAGVRRVFIGLENINPDNLLGAKKRQNKITEYRKMLLAWKAARVITYAGYILGFPNDSPASIEHDIEVIKRELPIDLLEFFYLTPLPGSEDHRRLVKAGTALDADLNKYDLNHVTTAHPRMSRDEWERTYLTAWQRYYTIDHIQTVLRRVASVGANASNALFLITWFKGSVISRRSTRSNAVSFDARSVATDAPASRSSRPGASIRSTSAKPQRNWRGGVGYTCGCGESILVSSMIRSVSSTPTSQ